MTEYTILIVDDVKLNRAILAETFRKVQQGYMRHFSSIEYAVYAEDEDDPNLRAFRAVLGS